jgi:hypothetical protein
MKQHTGLFGGSTQLAEQAALHGHRRPCHVDLHERVDDGDDRTQVNIEVNPGLHDVLDQEGHNADAADDAREPHQQLDRVIRNVSANWHSEHDVQRLPGTVQAIFQDGLEQRDDSDHGRPDSVARKHRV